MAERRLVKKKQGISLSHSRFLVAVVIAVLLAHPLVRASAYDQIQSDRAIFGEGTITAHDLSFPESEPGEISYQRVECTSEWLGDENYRVLIRATPMTCGGCDDAIPAENIEGVLHNESDEYVRLSESWTVIKDDIPPLTEIEDVYFRVRMPSPLSGGEFLGKWQIKLDAAVSLEEYAYERAWKLQNWLPWFLGLFGFTFTAGNWVVHQKFRKDCD